MRAIIFTIVFACALIARAQSVAVANSSSPENRSEFDDATQQALTQTQTLLTNPAKRQQAIANDPKAQTVHNQVQMLGGSPENTEKMYQMAAELMQQLTKQANGDPKKMQELMQNAQSSPEAFLNSLTPEQQAAIRALANDITAQRKKPAVVDHR